MPKMAFELPEEFILLEDARGKAGQEPLKYIKKQGHILKLLTKLSGYCEHGPTKTG